MNKLVTALLGHPLTGSPAGRKTGLDMDMSSVGPPPRPRDSILSRRVRLPDGRVGKVYMIEYGVGGHKIVVSIHVEGAKARFFGRIKPKPVRFADDEIDQLEEVPTEDEIQRILDDPEALGLED